jgi:hypothetical protein
MLVSSLSTQHWAFRPLLDWSAARSVPGPGPVPWSWTGPLVRDRSAATQARIGGIPDAPAIRSA